MSGLREDPAFRWAAEFLDRLGTRWAVIGGQVANEYRPRPRLTQDYDFCLSSLEGLVSRIEAEGFNVEYWHDSQNDNRLGQVRARRDGVRFDFNLTELPEYHDGMIARARVNDGIATLEDLLILKFMAWRERDRGDIRSILRGGVEFDERFVREWVAVLADEVIFDRELLFRDIGREADVKAGGASLEDRLVDLAYSNERGDWRTIRRLLASTAALDLAYIEGQLERLECRARASRIEELLGDHNAELSGPDLSL